jgi:hypothetical protein
MPVLPGCVSAVLRWYRASRALRWNDAKQAAVDWLPTEILFIQPEGSFLITLWIPANKRINNPEPSTVTPARAVNSGPGDGGTGQNMDGTVTTIRCVNAELW